MTNHKIAVIAGDGIGKEVVPEGMRVLDAAGRKFGFEFQWDELPWSCDYYLEHGRMMPEDGLDQIKRPRRDLPGRGRLAGHGAGPCLALGPAHQDPPRVRAVRQHPPGPADARHPLAAGRPQARRDRLHRRAREQRGRVFVDRRPQLRGHRAGDRAADDRLHPPRRRPDHALRLRPRRAPGRVTTSPRPPSPTAWPSSCPTGTSASPRWPRATRTSAPTSTISTS